VATPTGRPLSLPPLRFLDEGPCGVEFHLHGPALPAPHADHLGAAHHRNAQVGSAGRFTAPSGRATWSSRSDDSHRTTPALSNANAEHTTSKSADWSEQWVHLLKARVHLTASNQSAKRRPKLRPPSAEHQAVAATKRANPDRPSGKVSYRSERLSTTLAVK
jgi:hypothetical protein